MPTPEQIQGVLDAYVAGYNSNDREAVVALFAEDGELIDPVGAPGHQGAEAIRSFWDMVRSMTDGGIRLTPEHKVVCGSNEAAMVFEINAGKAGAGMRMTAIDVFEFDDDAKITRLKAYWDMEQGQPL